MRGIFKQNSNAFIIKDEDDEYIANPRYQDIPEPITEPAEIANKSLVDYNALMASKRQREEKEASRHRIFVLVFVIVGIVAVMTFLLFYKL